MNGNKRLRNSPDCDKSEKSEKSAHETNPPTTFTPKINELPQIIIKQQLFRNLKITLKK